MLNDDEKKKYEAIRFAELCHYFRFAGTAQERPCLTDDEVREIIRRDSKTE